nr:hypothetical protein [Rhodococcus sp. (in: high G+C Gram-positive bacteria)]
MLDEQKQLIYWSTAYGCHRGNIVQRTRYLLDQDIPEWDCENILERWQPVRSRSSKRWPTGVIEAQWIDEFAATKLIGCTTRTLRRWKSKNPRLSRQGKTCIEYSRTSLLDTQASMQAVKSSRIASMDTLVAA